MLRVAVLEVPHDALVLKQIEGDVMTVCGSADLFIPPNRFKVSNTTSVLWRVKYQCPACKLKGLIVQEVYILKIYTDKSDK